MTFIPEWGTGFEMGSVEVTPAAYRTDVAINTTTVKTGTYCIRIPGPDTGTRYIQFNRVVPSPYLDLGVWINPGGSSDRIVLTIDDTHTISLRRSSTDRTWDAYIDDALAEAGTIRTTSNAYQNVQLRVLVDGAAGYIQTRVDGADDVDYSGDTQPDTGTDIESVQIRTTGIPNYTLYTYVDDFVYGTDDWPGDIRFDGVVPDGDDSVEWTPSAGSDNYALVNEVPPSTLSSVSAGTAALTDKYTLGNWSGAAKTPQFVTVWAYAKKDTAGTIQLQLLVDSNGDEDVSSAMALSTSDAYYQHLVDSDPDTLGEWTDGIIDALKIGIRSA